MRYRFGELELDAASYTLSRAGVALRVWPKVFDVLRYLIEQRGRTVTKQELLDTLWSDSHVDEVAVPWTISHARRVLGQRSGDKSPIETVHGRGYRFTADVEVIEPRPSQAPPTAATLESRSSTTPSLSSATDTIDGFEPRASSPFVGRVDAMQQLRARLNDAQLGNGGLCVLKGPAGIGKTRCMDELARHAQQLGFAVWSGRSVEDSWAPVYWPWVQVVRDAAREASAFKPQADALLERLGNAGRDTDDSDEGNVTSESTFWWVDGVGRLLVESAAAKPLLVVLDDLHWADAATIDLLSFIAPELRRARVLVLASQRDGRTTASTRNFERLSRHTESIALSALNADEVTDYVCQVAKMSALEAELGAALHRATAGNPLFLQQTLRTLLTQHGEDLSSLSPSRVQPSNVARDVLGAALAVLPSSVRETLALASVLGERFDVATLQQLSNHTVEDLLLVLESARAEGFVIAEEPIACRFCHALLRSILYDALPADVRVLQHRRAAEVLSQSKAPRYGEIAHHYYASLALGDYPRVTAAALQAARVASRMQAFADANVYCEWALQSQALEADAQPRARAELLVFSAQLQFNAGQEDEARKTIDTLIELARPHRFYDLLVRAARVVRHTHTMGTIEDPKLRLLLEEALQHAPEGPNELRISALGQLSWVPPYALDIERSKALSGQALELARELSDERVLLRTLQARLYALSGPDDIDAQLATADEMLERNVVGRVWASAAALGARYGAYLYRGELARVDETCAEIGRLGHAGPSPAVIWFYERLMTQRGLLNGDLEGTSTALSTLREHGQRYRVSYASNLVDVLQGVLTIEQHGANALASGVDLSFIQDQLPSAMVSVRPSVARLLLARGQQAAARAVLDACARDGFALPKDINYLNALANLALLAIDLGEREHAEQLCALLSPYPHHNTPNVMLLYEGSVSYFLGALAVYLKRQEHVVRHFDDALAMNEALGNRSQLARTCHAYAQWLLTRQTAAATRNANDLLTRARTLAQQTGMLALATRLSN